MYNRINMSSIFVLDQNKAIDFYVGTLGLELTNDMDLGFMRWVTVGVPGEPGRNVLLELPGPPVMDEKTTEQVRELVTKGATGFCLGLTTDDCRKTYETLKARGVEFSSEPEEHFYGTDFGIRDPFGNNIRIVQLSTQDNGMPKTLEGRKPAKAKAVG
ncbi:MAG TPA: VOC family protein [Candidatus Dormibacteraeota bacterium]|nr:VOC family protein [Candidatus Dormibacteraeota bacterium]